jgi:hypothetical protein
MWKLKTLLLFIIFFFINRQPVKAQDEKFKSIFIYNFTKLIEWPADKLGAEFVIVVYGNSPIKNELDSLALKKSVYNKPIAIRQIKSLSETLEAQILYICNDKTTDLPPNLNMLVSKNILIITEKPSSCNLGSAINFVNKGGSLGFEISPSNIEKTKLKVNSQLLSLGTVVK